MANALPSMAVSEAEDAVRQQGGMIELVHMKNWREGAIRYRVKARGAVQVQLFHRTFVQALMGKMPFGRRSA